MNLIQFYLFSAFNYGCCHGAALQTFVSKLEAALARKNSEEEALKGIFWVTQDNVNQTSGFRQKETINKMMIVTESLQQVAV